MAAPTALKANLATLIDDIWDAYQAQVCDFTAYRLTVGSNVWKIWITKIPGKPIFIISFRRRDATPEEDW